MNKFESGGFVGSGVRLKSGLSMICINIFVIV